MLPRQRPLPITADVTLHGRAPSGCQFTLACGIPKNEDVTSDRPICRIEYLDTPRSPASPDLETITTAESLDCIALRFALRVQRISIGKPDLPGNPTGRVPIP